MEGLTDLEDFFGIYYCPRDSSFGDANLYCDAVSQVHKEVPELLKNRIANKIVKYLKGIHSVTDLVAQDRITSDSLCWFARTTGNKPSQHDYDQCL